MTHKTIPDGVTVDRTAAFEQAWAEYMHSALHASVPAPEAMFSAGWLAGMRHCLSLISVEKEGRKC